MSDHSSRYAAFRLNLTQQRKRAKELLKALQAQDPEAARRLARFHPRPTTLSGVRLADAQCVIARELGLASWPRLLRHIEASVATKAHIDRGRPAPDKRLATLHLRCGTDIEPTLREAGFEGDFQSYTDPLCGGPIARTPNWLELRADYIADSVGRHIGLDRAAISTQLHLEENAIAQAARYERVVLWFEHDLYDQAILARILTVLAHHRPRHLDLVSAGAYPGAARFIGLGQLPPEALILLWEKRKPVSPAALNIGCAAWAAISAPDPSALSRLAQEGTDPLPELGRALARFAREYPWAHDRLALSQRLVLQLIAGRPRRAGDVFRALTQQAEPLPWLADLMFRDLLATLSSAKEPAIIIEPGEDLNNWARDIVSLTDSGRDVLAGKRQWHSLGPAERWLGGVRVGYGSPDWVWNEAEETIGRREN